MLISVHNKLQVRNKMLHRLCVFNKVVKRLSVNRLPVKLPITGFNFQLPITDLPTFLQRVSIALAMQSAVLAMIDSV